MRLAKFEHMEPASLEEACGLLEKHGQKAAYSRSTGKRQR